MSPAPPPPSAPPPLRAVILGMGARGEGWLGVLASPGAAALGVVAVAAFDPDPDRARSALARTGRALPVPADLGEALALRPDLVLDCTSPHARLAIAREALRAGTHVLCDGPLAADEEAALALAGAAARATGRLCVDPEGRRRIGLRQLRALVAGGALGRPLSLSVRVGGVAEAGHAAAPRAILRGPGARAVDAARAILGRDAVRVRCAPPGGAGPSAGDDLLVASFEMAGDLVFTFSGEGGPAGPEAWTLLLDGGSAEWDGAGAARATPAGHEPRDLPPPDPPGQGLLAALAEVAAAIRAGRQPEPGPRDAAASLAMTLAAIRSADRGGRSEAVRPLGLMGDASSSPAPRPSRAHPAPVLPDPEAP